MRCGQDVGARLHPLNMSLRLQEISLVKRRESKSRCVMLRYGTCSNLIKSACTHSRLQNLPNTTLSSLNDSGQPLPTPAVVNAAVMSKITRAETIYKRKFLIVFASWPDTSTCNEMIRCSRDDLPFATALLKLQ